MARSQCDIQPLFLLYTFGQNLHKRNLLFCFVHLWGVWHNKQVCKTFVNGREHIMLFPPPTTITNLIDDGGGSTWTIAKKTKRFSLSLSTCGSETPCLARLMIDSLETPLYTIGIFSPTQLNVSLEGHHTFSLYLHVFSFFQNPNVFFWFAETICFLKCPNSFKSTPLLCGYQIFIFVYHSTIGWLSTNWLFLKLPK